MAGISWFAKIYSVLMLIFVNKNMPQKGSKRPLWHSWYAVRNKEKHNSKPTIL